MASISGATTTDGKFLNIQYSLNQDTFQFIRVRRYSATNLQYDLSSPNDVTHSTTGPISGNFSVLRPIEPIVSALGPLDILILEIRCVNSQGVAKSYTDYILISHTLDCCLAEKMNKVVDCNNDPNCDDHLDDAKKLYLFMKSAEFVLNTIPDTSGYDMAGLDATAIAKLNDAKAKYDKALELCSNTCC